jgi:putative ABC transport system ATP-binding protein
VPEQGEVWLESTKLNDLSENDRTKLRREHYGFVFQFGQLVPELTAMENVALSLLLSGMKRDKAFAVAEPWFARLGIAGLEKRRAGELSGGQGQRVALARALAMQPKVLFADEPTGALDTLAGEKVMELLVEATKNEGTTVVLVTHDARVAAYADREVIVRDGVIATNERRHLVAA